MSASPIPVAVETTAALPAVSVATPTREIETLKSAIEGVTVNLRAVSEELASERASRQKEAAQGISVLRLQVPFVMWFVTVGALVSAGIGGGMFYRTAQAHIADASIHVDRNKALAFDGVAYNREIDRKLADAVSDLEAGDRRISRVLRQPTTCQPLPGKSGAVECSFPDPTLLPLRP